MQQSIGASAIIKPTTTISRRAFNAILLAGGSALIAGPLLFKRGAPWTGSAPPGPAAIDYGRSLFLVNCTLVDAATGSVLPGRTIIIDGGRISAVAPAAAPGPGCEVIDLGHRYVIPGLIDAHCHATLTGSAAFDPFAFSTAPAHMRRNYAQQIAAGVTTVRDMGGFPAYLDAHAESIEAGALPGPRVVRGCALMNMHGRHPEIDPCDATIFHKAAQPPAPLWREHLCGMLEAARERGASFIKLNLDGMSHEEEALILRFARRHGLPLAGHHHRAEGLARGLALGVRSFEHTVADGNLSDRQVAALAARGAAVVPTLVAAQMRACEEAYAAVPARFMTAYLAEALRSRRALLGHEAPCGVDPALHARNRAALRHYDGLKGGNCYVRGEILAPPDLYFDVLRHAPANLRRLREAGVVIGCGTDAGTPLVYHGLLWREMELLGLAGLSNAEVLRCATVNNARILGLEGSVGTIAPGARADIAVLSANPLESLAACRAPLLVLRDGRVLHGAAGLVRSGAALSLSA